MTTFSDSFTRADEVPLSNGGNWVDMGAGLLAVSGNTCVVNNAGEDCDSIYTGGGTPVTWSNNQSSKAKLTTTGTAGDGSGPGLWVRGAINKSGYRVAINHGASNNIEILRFNAGAATSLTGGVKTQSWTSGDEWELIASGSVGAVVLTLKLNGVQVGTTVSDTSGSGIASGAPGLAYSSTGGGEVIDDWTGADLAGGDASVTSPVADGVGDVVAPSVSAGASSTSPVLDGTGDIANPAVSAGASTTSPVADGTGDIVAPTVTTSVSLPDPFTYTDGLLTDSGNWGDDPFGLGFTGMEVAGDEASGSSINLAAQAWWLGDQFSVDMRARYVLKVRPGSNGGSEVCNLGFVQDPGDAENAAGYTVGFYFDTSADKIRFTRFDVGATSETIGSVITLGSRIEVDDVLDFYLMDDGTLAAVINDVVVATDNDTTYFNGGEPAFPMMGISTAGTDTRVDDFDAADGVDLPGGVQISAVPASGLGDVASPTVAAGASVTAPPAAATGDIPIDNLPLSVDINLAPGADPSDPTNPVTMGGTGAMKAPTVTGTAEGTVIAPPMDGTGDVATPAPSAGSSTTAVPADGTGDIADPTVSAGGSVTSPAIDGTGDVADPTVSSGASVDAPAADGTGDVATPTVSGTASASVSATPARASGDLHVPQSISGGKILARIDLPTLVILAPYTTDVTIQPRTSTVDIDTRDDIAVVDPRLSVVAVDPRIATVSVDPRLAEVILDA